MKSKTINQGDLSYFRLSLLSFLNESHPELATDAKFITGRSELAAAIYSNAIHSGDTQIEAMEQANTILYEGLHFSKYDTLVNILWDEFSDKIPEERARDLAQRLLPKCEIIFAQYTLTDDFAGSVKYDSLRTELIGAIVIWLESGDANGDKDVL